MALRCAIDVAMRVTHDPCSHNYDPCSHNLRRRSTRLLHRVAEATRASPDGVIIATLASRETVKIRMGARELEEVVRMPGRRPSAGPASPLHGIGDTASSPANVALAVPIPH